MNDRSRFGWLVVLAALALPGAIAPRAAHAFVAPPVPAWVSAWGGYGTGNGQFAGATTCATDFLGNVFVVDRVSGRIEKFDAGGNFLTSWSYGLPNGPIGIATDASGNVFVSDFLVNTVFKYDGNGAFQFSFGGTGSGNGQFNGAYGLAVDALGNIYVGEYYGCRIQKFTSTGVYVTQWGSAGAGNGQFSAVAGLALDGAGNVYAADQAGNRIQKFTSSGAFVTKWGSAGTGNGQFNLVTSVAVDAVGNVYAVDNGNARVEKFTKDGAYLAQWGTPGAGNGQFDHPIGMAVNAAGDVYVVDWNNSRIQRFLGAGTFTERPAPTWVATGSVTLLQPVGMSSTNSETFYAEPNVLYEQLPGNSPVPVGLGSLFFDGATDVAFNPANENIYLSFADSNWVGWCHRTGYAAASAIQYFGGPVTGSGAGSGAGKFSSPRAVAFDDSGQVYVADFGNNRIQKFTSTGTYIMQWGGPGTGNGQFNGPRGIAIDASGSVFVSDAGNNRVQKFTRMGAYLGQWGSTGSAEGQFSAPGRMAILSNGDLLVIDSGNLRVVEYTAAGQLVSTWSGSPTENFANPTSVGTSQGKIVVFDRSTNVLVRAHEVFEYVFPTGGAKVLLVSDVGHDQGGRVRVRFAPDPTDVPNAPLPIVSYTIERRVDPSSPAVWTAVGSVPAHAESEYDAVVPTAFNASPGNVAYSTFRVRSVTPTPAVDFLSLPANGYSVDNLSPPPPAAATVANAAGQASLAWSASAAADLAGYRVYRAIGAPVTPSPDALIATTTRTTWSEPVVPGAAYAVTAFDRNGNESEAAAAKPDGTASATVPAPRFALVGVTPNPAPARALQVRFSLPDDAAARLELLDVAGRLVASRDVGALGAGEHAVGLAPATRVVPGLYFVRLTRGGVTRTARVTVVE